VKDESVSTAIRTCEVTAENFTFTFILSDVNAPDQKYRAKDCDFDCKNVKTNKRNNAVLFIGLIG
jgi:hypothetical protein